MRERFSELIEFILRAVHFHPGQISHLECFGEHRPNAVQMGQDTISIRVAFAAENLIAVDCKSVEKIFFLSRGFLDEGRQHGL